MQKILQRLFIVAVVSLVIWIWYSVQNFVPGDSILHSVAYHGKFAQWVEPPDHWQLSIGQFSSIYLLPWIGVYLFTNWKTGKMFDFK